MGVVDVVMTITTAAVLHCSALSCQTVPCSGSQYYHLARIIIILILNSLQLRADREVMISYGAWCSTVQSARNVMDCLLSNPSEDELLQNILHCTAQTAGFDGRESGWC